MDSRSRIRAGREYLTKRPWSLSRHASPKASGLPTTFVNATDCWPGTAIAQWETGVLVALATIATGTARGQWKAARTLLATGESLGGGSLPSFMDDATRVQSHRS